MKKRSKITKIFSAFAIILYFLIGIFAVALYSAIREERHEEQHYENIEEKQEKEWEYLTSTIGDFKVLFPIEPEHKTHYLDAGKLDMYIAEQSDGTTYLAETIEITPESDMSLQETLNGMLVSENELISSEYKTIEGYGALDASIKQKDSYRGGFMTQRVRIIKTDERFYVLITGEKNDYNKFFNSFQLTK